MDRGPLTIVDVLDDPAASAALKAVLRSWSDRDAVDAANDAEVLAQVLKARADGLLGGGR